MMREYPVQFYERLGVKSLHSTRRLLHCKSRKQAEYVLEKIARRFIECGLEIHPDKTKIVYCKDANRRAIAQEVAFDFLGYTFRPRKCIDKLGRIHPNFLPAISNKAMKGIRQEIRSWHIQLQNEKSLFDLSKKYNAILQGWYNYYGKFYASRLNNIWKHFNQYLVKWVRRKYKRFARHKRRAAEYVTCLAKTLPNLFVHWKLGIYPTAK